MLDDRDNFYITAFENVFANQNFIEAMGKVLEQFKSFKRNWIPDPSKNFFANFKEMEIKNKKLIFASLTTSLSLLMNVLPNLNKENIVYTAEKLKNSIKKTKAIFNSRYSSSEIFTVFALVFDRKFYSKVNVPFKIKDLKFLFKTQEASQALINFVIRLHFKDIRLHDKFKEIEKDRLNGKFSTLAMCILNNFIEDEKYQEQRFTGILDTFLGSPKLLNNFVKSFKNDQNEENVFNLIEITVREFKSKKTREEDLLRTVNAGSKIKEEIESYGVKRFKAFSDDVPEESIEWSNKIFINCCKLFGVISGLDKAVDKSWIINVCVKAFAEWTNSVHRILNKYDIEDDWDKISKYLDQESNKIEWKSTFLTPIEMKKDDPSYNTIRQKIFYGIIKTILGMINTDGGIIIIGLVENPEKIIDEDIRESILKKKGRLFLDISKELYKNKMDLDAIKRKIQDKLKKEALMSIDNFNNLWNIQPIIVKGEDGNREVTIYKIEISKSDKLIFSVKPEKGPEDNGMDIKKSENIWISILKRADARTIYGDPRKYLTSK